ncbi:hypothetical protein C5167_050703 [Papaver somniferum]|uniref:Pentacotripeptide-repeat region of PRORP domain-containing protein n=1 Tax=Papaver somniferum TaxID=3469 RepID=A0A4Y7KS56_PAPSO|nr:pentatricopeptide repeat-containing protein At5g11310, mitochondrial-like [Papaver somniferum]RZC75222.1 hypothetical protein C5167_050703 [Papaver somniferum]
MLIRLAQRFARTPKNPISISITNRLFSVSSSLESFLPIPRNPLIKRPSQTHHSKPNSQSSHQNQDEQNPSPNFLQRDCITICNLLKGSYNNLSPEKTLETALDETGIKPDSTLFQTILPHFDSSPEPFLSLYKWAVKQPSFDPDTFAVLIKQYTRAGMTSTAIRTFEIASELDSSHYTFSISSLFETLMDSLCKEGHVRIAYEYCVERRELEPGWVPSVGVYNVLLEGWFRLGKLKQAERLWEDMKTENVAPNVVTYGTLVEGYCKLRRVERAMELVSEMKREGIRSDAIVYNPIVDALSEAGRFKEALGMMERLLVTESGPTLSSYNSMVKGYCKAADSAGASKILKMMIGRGFIPTATTYNYFFRHFSKFGKIEEGMNLYSKMIESGYLPDRLTYHLLIKMLSEVGRSDLVVQVCKDMRVKGHGLDPATSSMLIHLLCNIRRFEEACVEFEDMIRRGVVPQYLTYKKLFDELKVAGMHEMARKLSVQMSSIPHEMKLPNTYRGGGDRSQEMRTSILRKAQAMSDVLKTSKNVWVPSKLRVLSKEPSEPRIDKQNVRRFSKDVKGV